MRIDRIKFVRFGKCFFLTLFLFSAGCCMNYAIDTYGDLLGNNWQWQIEGNGRLINAFFFYLAEKIPLHYNYIYSVSYLLDIISLSMAAYFLYLHILEKSNQSRDSAFLLLISTLSVSNYLLVNFFLWYESALYNFAILLNVCAALLFDDIMTAPERKEKIKLYLIVLVALLCVEMMYQATLSMFIVLSLPFILLESNGVRSFLKNNVIMLSLYALPSMFSMFLLKVVINSRRVSSSAGGTLSERIITVTENIFRIAFTGGHTFFPLLAFIVTAFFTVLAVSSGTGGKEKGIVFFSILYICIFGTVMVFAPYYLGVSADYSDRIYVPFASIPGAVAVYTWKKTDALHNLQHFRHLNSIVIFILGFLFLAQFYRNTQVFIERYKVNQTDRYIAMTIQNRIEEYESSSGNKIDTICIYYDRSRDKAYDNLDKYEASARAFDEQWSDVPLINYTNGTDYIRGEQSPQYAEYFSSRDWKTYSDDLLIFDGTTLHLCVY